MLVLSETGSIVDKALDVSRDYMEHERNEGELRDLLKRLRVSMDEDAFRALNRYVGLCESRRSDSDLETYGRGA